MIGLLPPILGFLQRWTILDKVCRGVPLTWPPLTRTIVTDASLIGWGAHLDSLKVQGLWSEWEASLYISVLELHAIYDACQTCQDQGCSISHTLWQYHHDVLREQVRGAHSKMLCQEAISLWHFFIQQNIRLGWSLGFQNQLMNNLSRNFSLIQELSLKPRFLQSVFDA